MKKKNNKKWTLVLVLLLVVSIGYAALASNLKINGTTGVKSATWDVYWNNVQVTQGSVETTQGNQARITDQAKTQVEYSVTLNEPGDFYEFTVDAVNNGTIDAMIEDGSIVKGVYSDSNYTQSVTLPKTISYTVTYADGTEIAPKHLLAKKTNGVATTETYKVRIEYKNDDSINPGDLDNTNDLTYYFKFSVNYVQADDNKIAVQHPVVKTWNKYYTPINDEGIGTFPTGAEYWVQENTTTHDREACIIDSGDTLCFGTETFFDIYEDVEADSENGSPIFEEGSTMASIIVDLYSRGFECYVSDAYIPCRSDESYIEFGGTQTTVSNNGDWCNIYSDPSLAYAHSYETYAECWDN